MQNVISTGGYFPYTIIKDLFWKGKPGKAQSRFPAEAQPNPIAPLAIVPITIAGRLSYIQYEIGVKVNIPRGI